MQTLSILASAKTNFIINSTAAYLIGGALFFGAGLALGWFLWRHFQDEANRFESENERLLEAYESREKAYIEHRDVISTLTGARNSKA